jgi:hypothetical protein
MIPYKNFIVYEGNHDQLDFMLRAMEFLADTPVIMITVNMGVIHEGYTRIINENGFDNPRNRRIIQLNGVPDEAIQELHEACICHIYSPLPILYFPGRFLLITSLKPEEVANVIKDVFEGKCDE